MFRIMYETSLLLLAILTLPLLLYRILFRQKYRKSLAQRLGIGFPHIDKQDRTLIWIHAVSVGETKAIATLAQKIKEGWDNPILIVSSVTETGHAEAIRSIPSADWHIYLPRPVDR